MVSGLFVILECRHGPDRVVREGPAFVFGVRQRRSDRRAAVEFIAKLQFYGNVADQDFAARVKAIKAAEFAGDQVEVLALDVRAIRLGALGCAEYEGRVIDRGAPPGFLQQPFVVTVSGRACPHPDADGFVVDVSLMQRTREGEPMPERDPAGDAFAQSLHLDAFDGPVVQDILLMDRPERGSRAPGVWVENTMLGAGSLWVIHRHPSARPALKWLTRIDSTSNQLVARRPVDGNLAGSSGSSVWLFEPGGSTRPDGTIEATTAWRLDENAPDAVSVPVSCAPGRPVPWSAFQVGAFGAWLGCQTALERGKSAPSWRVQRRLDPLTGAALAEFAIAPGPIHGDSRLVWAEETSVSQSKPCRVHAIDPATNKLVRTLALGSSWCEHLTIMGNDAWLAGTNNSVMKFDLTSGRAVYSVKLPKGRYVLGLAVAGDAVWVSTMPSADSDVAGLQLGSEGGLVRFDRTTGAMVGRILPTGTANRLIGVAENRVWLYDSEGAIVRVRIN